MSTRRSNSKGKTKREQERQAAWDQCNSVDRSDGSRHIGYHQREYEDQRFGTFPAHDDYSEESFPDDGFYEEEF